MAQAVIMPKVGIAMQEGRIVQWLKSEGDAVQKGEPLLEIESDKTTMEVEAETSGYLTQIVHGAEETVPVTEVIAYIGENPGDTEGDTEPKGHDHSQSHAGAQKAEVRPSETAEIQPGRPATAQGESQDRVMATPAARAFARVHNVDLKNAEPTGRRGEIRRADVERLVKAEASAASAAVAAQSGESGERVIRKGVKTQMARSHAEVPPVTLHAKADVTALKEARQSINAQQPDVHITYNDLIVFATARAILSYPRINSTLEGDAAIVHEHINLGVAVALEEGLIVPVIRNADRLSLFAIAQRIRDLSTRAREGRLTSEELSGATFTVTNLGMHGILWFTPIVNLPESAILGVGSVEQDVRIVDGRPTEKAIMGLSLTIDHRVLDGAHGAVFLSRVKQALENPFGLIAGVPVS